MTGTSDQVLFERDGHAGIITLNRPQALNALTLGMVRAMHPVLNAWANDPAIAHVIIRAAGERAFCAGGDIVQLYDWGRARDRTFLDFYREEYALNTLIKRFPKPYIALIDGIVMGGGVGVSIHGSHRIVTGNTTFAMPETGIGLFPDVGGSYFLPRLPGRLGMYLGLTGQRLKAPDCLYSGLATHHCARESQPDLIKALAAGTGPDAVLSSIDCVPETDARLPAVRTDIDRHFAHSTIGAILASLDAGGNEWCAATAATLRTKSPTSLKITCRQLTKGANLDFEQCMAMEMAIVTGIFSGHDFFEGTRAVVIDKDMQPEWQPASHDEVSDSAIDAFFASTG